MKEEKTRSLKNLNVALKKASTSEKLVWDFIMSNIKTASVEKVDLVDVNVLLNGLEKVYGHLMNTEKLIMAYEDMKIPGFICENTETLKNELQDFTKKVNLDVQSLKRKHL